MISIRPATPSDCDHVAAIEQDGLIRWGRDLLLKSLEDPYIFLIADVDGQPEGFIIAILAADELQIVNIVVQKTSRRSGMGSLLVKTISGIAASRGAFNCFLEVAVSNIAAIDFYIALGFKKTGRRRGFYSNGEDAFLMSATIALLAED
jgi:ribosomal-protein-alanine N-acetyltransferase